jgi:hypothetical protein
MDDFKVKAKQKVLQELMDMMDEKMVGSLKEKSPKFAKVDIASDDPELAENLKDKLVEGMEEEQEPEMQMMKGEKEEPEDEDDLRRLLDLYKNIK